MMLDPSKGWYSAQELAGLPGMPTTDRGIRISAEKNLWKSRSKERGKGLEYALTALPEETQRHIMGLAMDQAANPATRPVATAPVEAGADLEPGAHEASAVAAALPAVLPVPGQTVAVRGLTRAMKADGALTDQQRTQRDAGLVLCRAVEAAMTTTGLSMTQCCRALAGRLVAGQAHAELIAAAYATYVKPRKNAPPLGGVAAQASRLQKMMALFEQGRLAGDVGLYLVPGRRGKTGHNPVHVAAFLLAYCRPTRPPISEAYRAMVRDLEGRGLEPPSYTTVCRIEQSLPVTVKYRGRVTGSEWRALKPYIERDVSMFRSNDIWVGDGHSFKAKVAHPIHGQPFTPEVTVIIDWVSRKIVGWSVSLAESTVAVSDAFRHAQQVTRARPLVYYSDNGSGQTGKSLDCPISGTLARQGIAHQTGIPGNPQARGIIERLWQVTLIPLARTYPTCTWRGADGNTTNKMLKLLNRKDQGGVQVPSFRQLIDDVARVFDEYNLHHKHRELDDHAPEDEYQAKLDRDSIVFGPSDAELAALWMPELVRVPTRGRVSLFGNTYCKGDLVDLLPEGAKVRVRYDLHDARQVQLFTLEGVYLGAADWDSHKEDAFPVPRMDQLRQERAADKTRRGEKIIAEAQAELAPMIDLTPASRAPVIDLAQHITDEELAAMEARPVVRRDALPDLLELSRDGEDGEPTAEEDAPAVRPRRDYLDMALWLADDALDGDDTDDAGSRHDGKDKAAG